MNSSTKNKIKFALRIIIPVVFWLSLWQIASQIVLTVTEKDYFLPGIPQTLRSLYELAITGEFYLTILYTLLRVAVGISLGIILGVALAVLCRYVFIADAIITPIMSIIKSTPVASFITLVWLLLDGDSLAIAIAVLMVMPIIWQNVLNGFNSIDPNLSEVADVFQFSRFKRIRFLIAPPIIKFLIPGIITATGLGWKAEIAAEIMGYVKYSIGGQINDANYHSNTPLKFAWTLVIILFSIVLERLASYFFRRFKK